MNKPIFMACLGGVLAGFLGGFAFHSWRSRPVDELVRRYPLSTLSSESTLCVTTLQFLREKQVDRAINSLEDQLDGALIGLGPAYLSASPEIREATRARAALRLAREYRRTSPHVPDTAVAAAVASTLAIPIE